MLLALTKGGHFVPNDAVKRRYKRSKDNFWLEYKDLVDYWYLITNNQMDFEAVAEGSLNDQVIYSTELLRSFKESIGETYE